MEKLIEGFENYKIDEYGEIVQNALGPEGTKYIV